jgi:hypothetical protein
LFERPPSAACRTGAGAKPSSLRSRRAEGVPRTQRSPGAGFIGDPVERHVIVLHWISVGIVHSNDCSFWPTIAELSTYTVTEFPVPKSPIPGLNRIRRVFPSSVTDQVMMPFRSRLYLWSMILIWFGMICGLNDNRCNWMSIPHTLTRPLRFSTNWNMPAG